MTSVAIARPRPGGAGTARPAVTPPRRLASIDVLRGVVMVLMVLDHVRAYFTDVRFDPLDLTQASVPLFATRWITHLCAPAFVLLAGMSAFLSGRHRSKAELSRFLASRGLWLIFLEVTVISFGWYFSVDFSHGVILQVIWAIGVAMLVLAALVHLPIAEIAFLAVALIAAHNTLDGITGSDLWRILHVPGPLEHVHALVVYPVVPWIGVMALGYALGPVMLLEDGQRQRNLVLAGAAMLVGFVLLRAAGGYGDPSRWAASDPHAVLSFLKLQKYPPSLLFLLVTLGLGLVALGLLDRARGRVAAAFLTFGRVPLFFYVAHIYVLHAAALLLFQAQGLGAATGARLFLDFPPSYGVGLAGVYAVWVLIVAVLYPACRWFGERKRRGRAWWWSYL